ncbi:hypothetical protein [Candidatus Nitrosocosmicus sp. SS]|uniref:hypothetical protein n=1 Tax=Candidatus Nitrosocosmicus agrestis TaxID=2563600 RepID=UPI00122EA0D8|nr:hypothetical protein [Candidatus Nitrosocosmicus sp. SS]KAA2282789.1 hypothetical protein F1Z66_05730 [Candidatus Nitrosocosmicus sp. SS]KAF0870277.1 hypothetical protein E5N71_00040 [Candidatus Nitrosocosmicus sp. SS]
MTTVGEANPQGTVKLKNSVYNILSSMGKDADFLYSTADKYIEDAQNEGKDNLVAVWKEIKQDKIKHLSKLRHALRKKQKRKISLYSRSRSVVITSFY